MATIPEELNALVERMAPVDQQRVLAYARELAEGSTLPRTPLPPGTSPETLLRFTVAPDIAEAMQRALEECERIDTDE